MSYFKKLLLVLIWYGSCLKTLLWALFKICHILCWWTDKVLNGVNLCGFYRPLSTLNINHRLWQILSKGVITSSKMIKFPYLLMDECTDFVHSSNGLIGTYLYMYIFSHLHTHSIESSLKLVGFLSCRPIRCFKGLWYTIAAFLLLSNLLSIYTGNC